MYKKLYLFFVSLFLFLAISAQQTDPVVFTIDGKPIHKSEVEKAYKKGNEVAEEKVSLTDFIKSYIDFRLNVEEAKSQGLDTVRSFVDTYSSYKSRMAAPFLEDTISENLFVDKIYKRMLENVEINHVMAPFGKDIVFPSDTIDAYNKIASLREEILKKGFSGVKFENKSTQSMVARHEDRNGYIGWIVPFSFPYKVEDAAYSLPFNEISMPIRSTKGYHVIEVLNKRPAAGSVELEQVLFNFPHIPPKQNHIDSVGKVARRVYAELRSGADFDALCREFSRVHQTGDKGCYFGILDNGSNLPPDFVQAAFNLKNPGDISKPVMSVYGYHIVRLIKKIPVEAFDEKMKQQLKARIQKSDKIQELSDEKRNSLFSRFDIKTNEDAYLKLNEIAKTVSPRDSLFIASITNGEDVLLDIEGRRKYQVKEFAKYVQRHQNLMKPNTDDIQMYQISEASPLTLSTDILKEYYNTFVTILVSDYEVATLDERLPLFKEMVTAFSDELLAFDVLNKNVLAKVKIDEEGLSEFFKKNKDKYSLEESKYKGMIVYAKDERTLRKAEKIAKKEKDISRFIQKIRNTLNKNFIAVMIEPGLWGKGSNKYVNYKVFEGSKPTLDKNYPYFFVKGEMISKPEDYTDVRNEVEFDYQEKLMDDWYMYLRNKYKVDIDKSVLQTIK